MKNLEIKILLYVLSIMAWLVMSVLLIVIKTDADEREKSYLKYSPSRSLPPASIWNPVLNTDENGKVKSKSFFKYPDSKELPQGSIWNPLLTIPKKRKK